MWRMQDHTKAMTRPCGSAAASKSGRPSPAAAARLLGEMRWAGSGAPATAAPARTGVHGSCWAGAACGSGGGAAAAGSCCGGARGGADRWLGCSAEQAATVKSCRRRQRHQV